MIHKASKFVFVITLILFSSCVTTSNNDSEPSQSEDVTPSPQQSQNPVTPQNPFEAPLPSYEPGPVSRPAHKLLSQAEESWKAGRRDQALAFLNRAYRLDTTSPEIPLRHSEYYFQLDQFQKVESWGRKALGSRLLTSDQRRRIWHLIARARHRLGDLDGANQALAKASN